MELPEKTHFREIILGVFTDFPIYIQSTMDLDFWILGTLMDPQITEVLAKVTASLWVKAESTGRLTG